METKERFFTVYLHPARKGQTDVHNSYKEGFLVLHNVTIQADAMPQRRIKTASNLQVSRKSCA